MGRTHAFICREPPAHTCARTDYRHRIRSCGGRPKSALDKKYEKPVVILEKALYGHPDAGTIWEAHCDRCLRQVGFEPIPTWQSCYYHKELSLTLSVYVDDFKLAGPQGNLDQGWKLIRKFVNMFESSIILILKEYNLNSDSFP